MYLKDLRPGDIWCRDEKALAQNSWAYLVISTQRLSKRFPGATLRVMVLWNCLPDAKFIEYDFDETTQYYTHKIIRNGEVIK